jgi:hypothetical protein
MFSHYWMPRRQCGYLDAMIYGDHGVIYHDINLYLKPVIVIVEI